MRTALLALAVMVAFVACGKRATPGAAGSASGSGAAGTTIDEHPSTTPDSEGAVIPPGQEPLLIAIFAPSNGLPDGWVFAGAEVNRDSATISYVAGGKPAGLLLANPLRANKNAPLFKNDAIALYAADPAAGFDFAPLIAALQPGLARSANEWKWMTPKSLARKAEAEAAGVTAPAAEGQEVPVAAPAAEGQAAPAAEGQAAPAAAPAAEGQAAPAQEADPVPAPAPTPAATPAPATTPQAN